MKIEIADNQNYYPIKKRKIRQIVIEVLKEEKQAQKLPPHSPPSQGGDKGGVGELSIAFVDNEKIVELNKKFLGHNEPTDVISFPLEANGISGEIVVSAQMALETANAMHTDVEGELILYVIHGLLHLIGYDDTSKKKAQAMHKRENELLAKLANRE
ncbi:MAG TPA: rRNA maturation RNase YbeY [Candidatus Brocadiales bacterium]|nr:rRNA maturation RNase YbeY [Candidatus Brocadiales bacterium]